MSNDGKKVAAAWMDMRAGKNDRDVQWTVGTAGKFGPETTVHDVGSGTQGHPSLVFDKDGIAWCAWEDSRSGRNNMRIYVADAKTKKNVQLSDDGEGKCGYPTLASAGGTLGVVYEAGNGVSFRLLSSP
ncbi:MAG: exo-alpha-sialidase [Planctomycetes bacterium]|nr:exo-alpha-sialidase [Planctomycetota bacterium]